MNPQISVSPTRKGGRTEHRTEDRETQKLNERKKSGYPCNVLSCLGQAALHKCMKSVPRAGIQQHWSISITQQNRCDSDLPKQAGIPIHLKTTGVAHTLQASVSGICSIVSTCAGGIICMWAEKCIKFLILFQMGCQMSRNH